MAPRKKQVEKQEEEEINQRELDEMIDEELAFLYSEDRGEEVARRKELIKQVLERLEEEISNEVIKEVIQRLEQQQIENNPIAFNAFTVPLNEDRKGKEKIVEAPINPEGPKSLNDIQLGGNNPENGLINYKLKNKRTNLIIKELERNPETQGQYMLGGSYAAAIKGTTRPPDDVDIDFLSPESYRAAVEALKNMKGSKFNKGDDGITSFNFEEKYEPRPGKAIPVNVKIELVNLVTKNINQNVKEGHRAEMSTIKDLHPGTKIPTVEAMVINWMDRCIESMNAREEVNKVKSKGKGDLRNIKEITTKHNLTYDQIKACMKKEKFEYRAIWEEANRPVQRTASRMKLG